MKLKKQIKVFFILILFSGIVGGIYSFNSWFFTKYKIEKQNIEEKEKQNGKEIINNFENSSTEENNESLQEKSKTSSNSSKDKNKKRASEIYYCSEGDTLEGSKCITKSTLDATKVELRLEGTSDSYTILFDFATLAANYGIDVADVISAFQYACEEENGTFKINNSEKGSCVLEVAEEDKIYQYMCFDSSYTLEGTKCVKEVRIPAKVRYGCPEGYTQDGIYCVED